MSGAKFDNGNDDIGVDSSDSGQSEGESENGNDLNDFELTEEHLSVKADNVPLTPFNMKEELEEGHFDSEGMYHWKKRPKISDYWVDNIDRAPLCSATVKPNNEPSEGDTVSYLEEMCNPKEIFKKILCFLQPKETIAQCLRRLGKGNTLTASERWKRKRLGTLVTSDNSEKISELTGLANKLLTETGDYDIYTKTYEEITEIVASNKPVETQKLPTFDMFSDDDEEEDTDTEDKSISKTPTLDMFNDDSEEVKGMPCTNKSSTSLAKEATLDMFSEDGDEKKDTPCEDKPHISLAKEATLDKFSDDTEEQKDNVVDSISLTSS